MTSTEAITIINQHLATKGKEPVVLTTRIVRYWWDKINVALFEGELKSPKHVRLIEFITEYAWTIPNTKCKTRRIDLHIHPTYSTRKLFLMILIHEMVHAWEFQKFGRMGHGKRFFSWKPLVQTVFNLELEQFYAYDDGTPDTNECAPSSRGANQERSVGIDDCSRVNSPTNINDPKPKPIAFIV